MDAGVRADDGCRLWTCGAGHGDPLVFCHGGPGLWDTFDDLAAMFADTARTIRWDQRGCGRSQRRGPYSVARSIRDLDAVRRELAGPQVTLQGNFDPAKLLAPIPVIQKEVRKMLDAFGGQRHIANLGHGILPNVPVDHARAFVDAVKEYGKVEKVIR